MVLYADLNISDKYDDYPEGNLGERIRKLRNMKGLTAEELGNLCKCSKNSIYAYESNNSNPGRKTLKNIAKALDVKIGYLKK